MTIPLDFQSLRMLAERRIAAGALPDRQPPRFFGGSSHGEPCSLCGAPITDGLPSVEFTRHASDTAHLHLTCFRAYRLSISRPSTGDVIHNRP